MQLPSVSHRSECCDRKCLNLLTLCRNTPQTEHRTQARFVCLTKALLDSATYEHMRRPHCPPHAMRCDARFLRVTLVIFNESSVSHKEKYSILILFFMYSNLKKNHANETSRSSSHVSKFETRHSRHLKGMWSASSPSVRMGKRFATLMYFHR